MKKKLSILIYSLAGGGAERVVSVLLNALKDEYNITLVLMNETIVYKIPENIHIYYLEKSKACEHGMLKLFKLPYLGWKYKNFCKQNNIDISLAFSNRPSYISILAKSFGSISKTIISERSTPSKIYRKRNFLSIINKWLIKNLYPKADNIITNSYGNSEDLTKNFRIDESLLHTIYNPFDLDDISILSQKQVVDVSFDVFTYITVGRLDEGKNHQLLIEVFSQLENKKTQLLILGEGKLYKTLERQIKILKLETRVFLLGFCPNPYKYMAKADVFVFSSNYEGFPNVLVEALACGLPIISTDCLSGPSEILSDERSIHIENMVKKEYGILVPINNVQLFKDAVQLLIDDPTLFVYYKIKSKDRAKIFNKNKIIEKYIELLS